eukprot:TRINITY_DN5070_c3_g1_i2.p1 TRINITY_DN5070_c3_g1~~TRINITY_DN5070_c3_g1_i2.p1  ORF type:complete len:338 (-),score=57.96 TRINITY_DN5070_c3_g1_i2:72-1085(-)
MASSSWTWAATTSPLGAWCVCSNRARSSRRLSLWWWCRPAKPSKQRRRQGPDNRLSYVSEPITRKKLLAALVSCKDEPVTPRGTLSSEEICLLEGTSPELDAHDRRQSLPCSGFFDLVRERRVSEPSVGGPRVPPLLPAPTLVVREGPLLPTLASLGYVSPTRHAGGDVSPLNHLYNSPRGCRILVAEDNLVNQKVVFKHLEKIGVGVEIANDGAEAVATVMRFGPLYFDMILMDLFMPNKSGFEATAEIRRWEASLGSTTRIPIVALSASIMPGIHDKCREAGMDDFLSKPWSKQRFLDIVARYTSLGPGVAPGQSVEASPCFSPVPDLLPALPLS